MRLPTFLIVGTHKGGTSSLLQFVCRHPRVGRPERKEVHFFDRHYDRGLDWYAEQFPTTRRLRRLEHVGEATPAYMYDADARSRMARDLPDARIIVTLRDPVSRAYSHYWHARRYGKETLSFEDALQAEPERLAGADRRTRNSYSYLDRGRYLGQLEALTDLFGRDSICVTTLEQTIADPQQQIGRVLAHLGLDSAKVSSWEMPQANAHTSITPGQRRKLRAAGKDLPDEIVGYPAMSPVTRASLREYFAADDDALLAWLGWSTLPWGDRTA